LEEVNIKRDAVRTSRTPNGRGTPWQSWENALPSGARFPRILFPRLRLRQLWPHAILPAFRRTRMYLSTDLRGRQLHLMDPHLGPNPPFFP